MAKTLKQAVKKVAQVAAKRTAEQVSDLFRVADAVYSAAHLGRTSNIHLRQGVLEANGVTINNVKYAVPNAVEFVAQSPDARAVMLDKSLPGGPDVLAAVLYGDDPDLSPAWKQYFAAIKGLCAERGATFTIPTSTRKSSPTKADVVIKAWNA